MRRCVRKRKGEYFDRQNCTLDDLFRGDMAAYGETYTNLRIETVPAFRYIKHAVISTDPEGDAVNNVIAIARSCGVDPPRVIEYMRVNGLEHTEKNVIPCFETDGESMDIHIACK